MEVDLPIDATHTIPGQELWFTTSRSGGPGGQHVNKTCSRVTLHWNLLKTEACSAYLKARLLRVLAGRLTHDGIMLIHVDDERSQHRNKVIARERLAELVKAALKPEKPRVPTKVSEGAKKRRRSEKAMHSKSKRLRRTPEVDF